MVRRMTEYVFRGHAELLSGINWDREKKRIVRTRGESTVVFKHLFAFYICTSGSELRLLRQASGCLLPSNAEVHDATLHFLFTSSLPKIRRIGWHNCTRVWRHQQNTQFWGVVAKWVAFRSYSWHQNHICAKQSCFNLLVCLFLLFFALAKIPSKMNHSKIRRDLCRHYPSNLMAWKLQRQGNNLRMTYVLIASFTRCSPRVCWVKHVWMKSLHELLQINPWRVTT